MIPAYNEEKNIEAVVKAVRGENPDYRVVVVDDCSSDRTAELARQSGAVVLRHLINRGQGAALRTGTDFSLRQGAQVVVHFDADGQFEAKEIAGLTAPITRGETEAVLGSRFLAPGNRVPWSKSRFILPLGRLVNFLVAGRWLSDAHNGFRAFSAKAARLVTIEQDRMAHGTEIVDKIIRHRLTFKEVPVTVRYHRYGQGWLGGITIVKDLILGKYL